MSREFLEIHPDVMYAVDRLATLWKRQTRYFKDNYCRTAGEPDDPSRLLLVECRGTYVSLGAWVIAWALGGYDEPKPKGKGGVEK